MFFNNRTIGGTWQAFERLTARFLLHAGYDGVRLVGRTGDKGADIIASLRGKRWLFQVKCWKNKVGLAEVEEVIRALSEYDAEIPALVSLSGFQNDVVRRQQEIMARRVPIQLWSGPSMVRRAMTFPDDYPRPLEEVFQPRSYQENAIQAILGAHQNNPSGRAFVVMATGLGKTRVVFEALRRMITSAKLKVLVLAHTNELVYQLERASWPYLVASQETVVWNGVERQSEFSFQSADWIFACVNTVDAYLRNGGEIPEVDVVFVDECHHVSKSGMYANVLECIGAGIRGGAFLIGTTATPWRPDKSDLVDFFAPPLVKINMVTGMRCGYLSNVDYRMYTTNIDWTKLKLSSGRKSRLSLKGINRTLFIDEWDDAVVAEIRRAWDEQIAPRVIVFCSTVDHAETMKEKINAFRFCRAEAIFSRSADGKRMEASVRNKMLCDFHDGHIQVMCAVEIFNEGIDVPDVNIVVFQRVTHSRRIFVQQLGRGLRLSPSKDKVIVLDFVSDVRRFAAGIDLKDALASSMPQGSRETRININHRISFHRYGGEDPQTENFLREWLGDIAAVEGADEDSHVLKFPPTNMLPKFS